MKLKLFVLVVLAPAMAWAQAPPPNPPRVVNFVCQGGERLTVTFRGGAARLVDPRGRTFILQQQISGSGIRYAGQGQTLRGKGREMTWTPDRGRPRNCLTRLPRRRR